MLHSKIIGKFEESASEICDKCCYQDHSITCPMIDEDTLLCMDMDRKAGYIIDDDEEYSEDKTAVYFVKLSESLKNI